MVTRCEPTATSYYRGSGGRNIFRLLPTGDRDVHARIPAIAASDTARPCRLDGHILTHRLHVPVKVRGRTREALQNGRDTRPTLLVNPVTRQVEAVKVEWIARTLLPAAAMIDFTSGKHLFELQPDS